MFFIFQSSDITGLQYVYIAWIPLTTLRFLDIIYIIIMFNRYDVRFFTYAFFLTLLGHLATIISIVVSFMTYKGEDRLVNMPMYDLACFGAYRGLVYSLGPIFRYQRKMRRNRRIVRRYWYSEACTELVSRLSHKLSRKVLKPFYTVLKTKKPRATVAQSNTDEYLIQMVKATYIAICFLLCAVGLILTIPFDESQMTFIDILYFVFVTISTIGYGDITPTTPIGRLFIALMIFLAMAVIPYYLTVGIQRLKKTKVFNSVRRANANGHLVVAEQSTSFVRLTRLSLKPIWKLGLIDMLPEDLRSNEVLLKTLDSPTMGCISLRANEIITSDLLMKVGAPSASSIIVVVPNRCNAISDAQSLRMMLTIAQVANPNSIMTCLVRDASLVWQISHFLHIDQELLSVICISEVLSRLLTINLLFPGFATFLINLLIPDRLAIHKLEREHFVTEHACSPNDGVYHFANDKTAALSELKIRSNAASLLIVPKLHPPSSEGAHSGITPPTASRWSTSIPQMSRQSGINIETINSVDSLQDGASEHPAAKEFFRRLNSIKYRGHIHRRMGMNSHLAEKDICFLSEAEEHIPWHLNDVQASNVSTDDVTVQKQHHLLGTNLSQLSLSHSVPMRNSSQIDSVDSAVILPYSTHSSLRHMSHGLKHERTAIRLRAHLSQKKVHFDTESNTAPTPSMHGRSTEALIHSHLSHPLLYKSAKPKANQELDNSSPTAMFPAPESTIWLANIHEPDTDHASHQTILGPLPDTVLHTEQLKQIAPLHLDASDTEEACSRNSILFEHQTSCQEDIPVHVRSDSCSGLPLKNDLSQLNLSLVSALVQQTASQHQEEPPDRRHSRVESVIANETELSDIAYFFPSESETTRISTSTSLLHEPTLGPLGPTVAMQSPIRRSMSTRFSTASENLGDVSINTTLVRAFQQENEANFVRMNSVNRIEDANNVNAIHNIAEAVHMFMGHVAVFPSIRVLDSLFDIKRDFMFNSIRFNNRIAIRTSYESNIAIFLLRESATDQVSKNADNFEICNILEDPEDLCPADRKGSYSAKVLSSGIYGFDASIQHEKRAPFKAVDRYSGADLITERSTLYAQTVGSFNKFILQPVYRNLAYNYTLQYIQDDGATVYTKLVERIFIEDLSERNPSALRTTKMANAKFSLFEPSLKLHPQTCKLTLVILSLFDTCFWKTFIKTLLTVNFRFSEISVIISETLDSVSEFLLLCKESTISYTTSGVPIQYAVKDVTNLAEMVEHGLSSSDTVLIFSFDDVHQGSEGYILALSAICRTLKVPHIHVYANNVVGTMMSSGHGFSEMFKSGMFIPNMDAILTSSALNSLQNTFLCLKLMNKIYWNLDHFRRFSVSFLETLNDEHPRVLMVENLHKICALLRFEILFFCLSGHIMAAPDLSILVQSGDYVVVFPG